jgi:4a-hydroxytetrahydrobiopterin dehydratase
VNLIGEAAEAANHHPDLDLRYPLLNVRLLSHDVGGVTERDVALARRISELAAGLGVTADPSVVSVMEIALDTPDHERIKPFWQAVLGSPDKPGSDDEVRNDDAALPTIWFQASGAEEPRQRFHIDIRVPAEMAQQRIDAAVAAGGQVVDEASTFVVLADADGNKVCVCRN